MHEPQNLENQRKQSQDTSRCWAVRRRRNEIGFNNKPAFSSLAQWPIDVSFPLSYWPLTLLFYWWSRIISCAWRLHPGTKKASERRIDRRLVSQPQGFNRRKDCLTGLCSRGPTKRQEGRIQKVGPGDWFACSFIILCSRTQGTVIILREQACDSKSLRLSWSGSCFSDHWLETAAALETN